jgi:hypothetical protein
LHLDTTRSAWSSPTTAAASADGGTITLQSDGTTIGKGRIERTHPYMFSFDETVDIGLETGSPVSRDNNSGGNTFTGTIDWVRIDIGEDNHDHLADPDHHIQIAMTRQ